MGLSLYDERFPSNKFVQLLPADTTTWKLMHDTNARPFRIDNLLINSTCAGDHVVMLALAASDAERVGAVTVPAGAGNGTVPTVDLIAALPALAQGGVVVVSTRSVYVKTTVTVGAGEALTFFEVGGEVG